MTNGDEISSIVMERSEYQASVSNHAGCHSATSPPNAPSSTSAVTPAMSGAK